METELIYLKNQSVLGGVAIGDLVEIKYGEVSWSKFSFDYAFPHKSPGGMYIGDSHIAKKGLIRVLSGLSIGTSYYVSAQGVLTTDALYGLPYVGFAISSTEFLLNIHPVKLHNSVLYHEKEHTINVPIGYLSYYDYTITTWEKAVGQLVDAVYIGNDIFLLSGHSYIDISSYIIGGLNTNLYVPCYRDEVNSERITVTVGRALIGFWVKSYGFYYNKNQVFNYYGFAEGGTDGSNLQDCDRYSDTGNAWSSRTDMPSPARSLLASFSLDSNYGFAIGGLNAGQDCDRYNNIGNSWSSRTDMPSPGRNSLASFAIETDYGFAAGGYSGGDLSDCDRYSDTGNSWSARASMLATRSRSTGFGGFSSISGLDGYIIGGTRGTTYLQDWNVYSNTANAWYTTSVDIPFPPRYNLASFTIEAYGFVIGGNYGSTHLADCDRLAIAGNSWSSRTDMLGQRTLLAGFGFGDDYGFTIGGKHYGPSFQVCDRYSDIGNSWSSRDSMPSPGRDSLVGFNL